MVVEYSGQPWPYRLAAGVSNEQVKLSMIGLPNRIRVTCTVTVYQLELVAEAGRPFVSQRGQSRVHPRDDGVYGAVRRR